MLSCLCLDNVLWHYWGNLKNIRWWGTKSWKHEWIDVQHCFRDASAPKNTTKYVPHMFQNVSACKCRHMVVGTLKRSVVICCAEKKSTNCIPSRNMLSQHSSSSMTFLSLRSGPLWNFTRMGDNVKSKLVRISQKKIYLISNTPSWRESFAKPWDLKSLITVKAHLVRRCKEVNEIWSTKIVVKSIFFLFCHPTLGKSFFKQKQSQIHGTPVMLQTLVTGFWERISTQHWSS